MPQSERLLLGVIAGPRGIRGDVKLKTFTEHPEDIVSYGPLENKTGTVIYKLSLIGFSKTMPVVRIEGISDRNKAEALKGEELYISRDRLPEMNDADEFYHADLIGLEAVDTNGVKFGTVLRLFDFGAGDMLEIVPDGKTARSSVLVPFTRGMVPEVDVSSRRLVLDLPEDFFETPDRREEGNSGGSDE